MNALRPLLGSRLLVGLICGAAATGGALSDGSPTGLGVLDTVFRACFAGLMAWGASTAPRPVVIATVGAIGVAGISNPAIGGLALVAAGVLTVLELRASPSDDGTEQSGDGTDQGPRRDGIACVVGAIGALVALRLPRVLVFGGSALVAGVCGLTIVAAGVSRQTPAVRAWARRVALGIGAAVGVIGIGSGVTFFLAARHAGDAQRHLRAALEATNGGRLDEATNKLAGAQTDIDAARSALDAPWGWLGRGLPIVAQHRGVAVDLAEHAHGTVSVALDAARAADLDQLKVTGGRADVAKIAAMLEPLRTLGGSISTLRGQLDAPRPGWIIAPLNDRVVSADGDLAQAETQLANLTEVVRLAPDLLGSTSERRILIAFLTPSEARPLGGHMANYGELTINDGRLELSNFGRASDLIKLSTDPATRVISGPDAYLERYGPFGAGGNGTPAGRDWWLNVTISPDFPSVAQVMAEMYTKATGHPVDNVLTIDPSGLAGLLSITGPIDAKGLPEQLTEENVVQLLEHDQYALFGREGREERLEFLGDAGRATFDALIGRRRLDPVVLVKHLAPAVASNHVMLWSAHESEQQLFAKLHATGEFTRTDSAPDALAVTSLNSGANKTDAFLTRHTRYEAVVDDVTGTLTGTVTVTLYNDAPASGLPFHVIGNSVDEPFGSNRTYLTMYRDGGAVSTMTVDGQSVSPATGTELGWTYAEYRHTLSPGGTAIVRYEVTGQVDPTVPYALFVRKQPLANPEQLTVAVHLASGGVIASYDGLIDRHMTISGIMQPKPADVPLTPN